MNDPQNVIRKTGYTFQSKLKKEYEKYYAVVEQQALSPEEEKGFEIFKDAFKKNQKIPFVEELTYLSLNNSEKNPLLTPDLISDHQKFEEQQILVKRLPNADEELIARLYKEISRALNLNKIFEKHVGIPGTKYNQLDVFPVTGMFFVPAFLELIEKNKEFLFSYFKNLLNVPDNEDIYFSPHIYRVEKGQSGTYIHNDFNAHVIDDFKAVESFKDGRKIVFYHFALTDISEKTCNLAIYPSTHAEFATYVYAFEYITKYNLFQSEKEKDVLLKAFYLSTQGLGGLAARVCLLDKYYLHKYPNDIDGVTAFVNKGEGIFFNPFALHSSLDAHQEDAPRLTVAIRITNRPTEYFKPEYFDFITHSLAEIFNLDYSRLLNLLYNNQQPNREQYLEVLSSDPKKDKSNITIDNMKNLFMETQSFFNTDEFNVSEKSMNKIEGFLNHYNT
jgi:hypothetical protein